MELAVFLLAGRGSRLNRYTEIIPKSMVEVSGKPILHRMLEILLKKGIKKAIFVVGYKWENIFESVGENWNGIEIQYINNTDWAKTNNIVSFYMAKDAINEDFLLIEGDIIIAQNALESFRSGQNQMAVSLFEPFMDGTVVTINKNNKIEKIYLKSDINSSINLAKTYKTVNIYGLKNEDFQKFVVPAFKDIIDNGKVNSYYEQAFAQLVNNGLIKFDAVDYSDLKWYEVDNEQDLEEAERIFSK